MKSMVIDMTEYQKKTWNNARNKWYALSMFLSESECETRVIKMAVGAGFQSTCAMHDYFKRWGERMIEHYGKLPYRMLNSSFYEKFMEMK